MVQNVFIIGTGNVGKELVKQVNQKRDTDPVLHENPTRIVGMANSRGYIFRPSGLDQGEQRNFIMGFMRDGSRISIPALLRLPKERTVFIDLTASEDMLALHESAILETEHSIVTANKKPLVLADSTTFWRMTRDRSRYGYRCSVMAGSSAVYELQYSVDLNKSIVSMEGVLSGTLSYLSGRMESGMTLSESVADAFARKYMEPDMRDDLAGTDAIRKMVILARSAGFKATMKNVRATSFVPEECLQSTDPEETIRALKAQDQGFRSSFANAQGKVLRYVLSLNVDEDRNAHITAAPRWVDRDSPFGVLKNTENRLIAYGKENGITVQEYDSYPQAGAGVEKTAEKIRWDLVDLLAGDRKIAFR